MFYLEVLRTGAIVFGDSILADQQSGVQKEAYAEFKKDLHQADQPLVLVQYPHPETSDINPEYVKDFQRTLTEDGFQVRLVEKQE